MKITLIGSPTEQDWQECYRRALVTEGKDVSYLREPPSAQWRQRILEARHSPIRYLVYSFLVEGIPGNTATHFARHVHAQPYISSLRNDRQTIMDGDEAPRNTPVSMILDVNAEELQVIANKRLCKKAAELTQYVTAVMCSLAIVATPELKPLLVPMCEYHGGVCHEIKSCGRCSK